MRTPETKQPVPERDISNPEVQKMLLLDQDPRLLQPIAEFASKIKSLPPDPKYPDLEPQAYLVGGFVRDALLGLHPKDADLEVMGVSAERLEELLDQMFPEKVEKVGQQFVVLKVHIDENLDFDVATPRRDSKTGKGYTGFTVQSDPSMTIKEASLRRDLTWNAIYADVLTGEVIDPHGGIEDLKNKILRVIDPKTFMEDPLRILRVVQFVARLDCEIEPESKELLKKMVAENMLTELPPDRITAELEKLLFKSAQPSKGFETARELGIIEKHMPELHALIETPQEPEFHPEGNVWIHTMMVIDQAAKIINKEDCGLTDQEKLEVMLGALCHDFGKPETTKEEDGRIKAHGHEEAGVEPAKEFLSRLSFNQKVVKSVLLTTAQHLKPAQLYKEMEKGKLDEKKYASAVRRLMKRIRPVSWKVLAAVAESDSRGRTIPGADTDPYLPGEAMAKAVREYNLDAEAKENLVGGDDIISIANSLGKEVKPGIIFGQWISAIEDMRDRDEIYTREEALEKLKELIKNN